MHPSMTTEFRLIMKKFCSWQEIDIDGTYCSYHFQECPYNSIQHAKNKGCHDCRPSKEEKGKDRRRREQEEWDW